MFDYKGIVEEAYDGDGKYVIQIDVGMKMFIHKECRLFGVDCPELKGEHRDAGLIVRDFVRGKILFNDVVVRTHKDKNGMYGRLLVDIEVNGTDLAELLLEKGYAKPYDKKREPWTHKELDHIIKSPYF